MLWINDNGNILRFYLMLTTYIYMFDLMFSYLFVMLKTLTQRHSVSSSLIIHDYLLLEWRPTRDLSSSQVYFFFDVVTFLLFVEKMKFLIW